ncbi:MAG: helix-turn-helix domain-containing protein [Spirochaetales bacterium]|nr:helix-turn-helix domain-containing protein [Spirochaetales bacterium]
MDNKKIKLIKETILYIEEKINEPLSLEVISKDVGISLSHLHRVFSSLTGEPLMTYIRKRKLSSSINELLKSNLSILDIALEYGFDYEQSYIRAFNQYFNITPAQYRKHGGELKVTVPIDLSKSESIGEGLFLEPTFIWKSGLRIQGYRDTIVHRENYDEQTTNQQVEYYRKNYLPLIKGIINENIYIGLVMYSDNTTYCNDYLTGTIVSDDYVTVKDLSIINLPSSEYAVFKYIGFHSPFEITYKLLFQIYEYIFGTWMNQNIYSGKTNYHFEQVNRDLCNDDYCEMDIYIPVGKVFAKVDL